MKTAIDCYSRGKQKESNADDFHKGSYYFVGRFICPECGENVHLTSSKYANFFSHYKKTEISAECDRRVDGTPTDSLYEKVGIPIILRKDPLLGYTFNLGFRPLSENVLHNAEEKGMSLCIGTTKYQINSQRFSSEKLTLIQISDLPRCDSKNEIKYVPKTDNIIVKFWSDYYEGFSEQGAIFSVLQNGGKQIRHSDSITTDEDYFWVRKQNSLPWGVPGISMERVGEVYLKSSTYYIFKGHFESNLSDDQFRKVEYFVKNSLHLFLLEKKPEFRPLWPPAIKSDFGYEVYGCNEIWGYIESGNDEPTVYTYNGVNSIPEVANSNDRVMKLRLSSQYTTVNIDRKYVSNGVTIRKNTSLREVGVPTTVRINDEYERDAYLFYGMDISEYLQSIYSDLPLEALIIKNGNEFIYYESISLGMDELSPGSIIFIIWKAKCILAFEYPKDIDCVGKNDFDEKRMLFDIKTYHVGNYVTIPQDIRLLCEKVISETSCMELRLMIKQFCNNNSIPAALIRKWRS